MNKKKIIAAFTAVSMIISAFSGCLPVDPGKLVSGTTEGVADSQTTSVAADSTNLAELSGGHGTALSLSEDGSLAINRISLSEQSPMGQSGIWTVFVYLCGTDLESNGAGQATEDLLEMQEATEATPNLRFVVETGGTYDWASEIPGEKKSRFIIQNGGFDSVYEGDETNMGESSTLQSFLEWGVQNYASEKMGVVFWNHGGGSISGVCFDELHDYDSLSLREIESAFTAVFAKMTDKFEFIGFDACLMATVETANILVPFARYMYASEELESGYGWNYRSFGEAVAKNAVTDGLTLGKTVCDGFLADNKTYGEDAMATLSVVELSKIDAFLTSFNVYAKNLYEAAGSSKNAEIIRAVSTAENYGGNNQAEGYTNMVDLGGIISSTSAYAEGADAALAALKSCVSYKVQGYLRPNGFGLSVYYPIEIQGSTEISTLKDICISPYYATFVDLVAYSGSTNGQTAGFDDSNWLGEDSWFWSDESTAGNDSWYWNEGTGDSGYNFDTSETALSYSVYPHMSEDGYYCLTVSPETLQYLSTVYCNVLMAAEENGTEIMIDLGTDDYVNVNWDTGEISDNFNGLWFSLPDGQPIAVYLIEETTEYNIYSAPVYLNGSTDISYLRIELRYTDDGISTTILGVVSGIDENGCSSRESTPLNVGDKIVPCYNAYDAATGDFLSYYEGYEYTFNGDSAITETKLYENDYYYGYELFDIYGNALYTDFTTFNVDENGDIFFYPEDSDENGWGWGESFDWWADETTETDDQWLFG